MFGANDRSRSRGALGVVVALFLCGGLVGPGRSNHAQAAPPGKSEADPPRPVDRERAARAVGTEGEGPMQDEGEKVSCAVRSIHAQKAAGEFDKRLEPLRKLLQTVLPDYKAFRLLSSTDLDIPRGQDRKASLPTGEELKLSFIEKLLGRKDHIKLRMKLSVPPRIESMVYTITDGGTHFAGWDHQGGRLAIAITCKAH